MAFCLPKLNAQKFLKALQEGEITPEKMQAMSSLARRQFFEGIVGKENAKEVNALLESKFLLKDQGRGMVTWAKNVLGLSAKDKADLVSRISKMDKLLDPADKEKFLSEVAEKKLGVGVSADEMQHILDLSKKADSLKPANQKMSGFSDDYLIARQELRDYIDSRKPVSSWGSIIGNLNVIGRNHLLMNPATPIKATENQAANYLMDKVSRRIGALSAKSYVPELAEKANEEAWQTFQKTKLNTAAMESIDDTGQLGEKNRFKPNVGRDNSGRAVNAVESATRKYAQITNKIAIDWEHNISFVKFYQKTFFDGLNVIASEMAKKENLGAIEGQKATASEIFQDAARIQPKTAAGAAARAAAQEQAARVTSINNTPFSRASLGIKDAMNKAVPRLGDVVVPIAKIPANVIWNGIENSGVGIPLGLRDLFQGRQKTQSDDLATRYEGMAQMAKGIQKIGRTVGVMTAAALFASQLSPRDFRQDKYGNNFVKIGNLWINMEYFSAASPALAGFMSVKQNSEKEKGVRDKIAQYGKGAVSGWKSVPGIDEAVHLYETATDGNWGKYTKGFFSSRGLPVFMENLMKNRPIERLFFGAQGVESQGEIKQDELERKKNKENKK